ncbi:dihydroorotase [Oribacterium sp. P6A1]|uniref:dihydroorotase n=1 Tax=Oribacterium sp. P6A1 TaxID=1410612 RepID=UPI00055DF1BA|nr:dihydroorotase [Oribacterium sp. P6A1]
MKLIKGGRVIDPANNIDRITDILIDDSGRIQRVGDYDAEDSCEDVIDAEGKVVAPGFVDVHVHFRDPGLTYKEDIETGARAAAAGGYTTVICMANTKPPVDSVEILTELTEREKQLPIHVLQTANVTLSMQGRELTDMDALHSAGAVGFTDDGVPIADEKLMVKALAKCKELDVPISLHEEDPSLMFSAGVNKGPVSEKLGLGGAPDEAEYVLAARDILLNRKTGAKLDIQHISSGVTVDVIRAAKKSGIKVYGEVTPQHLSATEDLVLTKGALAKVNPPLRTEEDRQALIRGLADGTIDMIATDHAPHSSEEKSKPVSEAPSGMIGLETALGLVITHTVRTGQLSLAQIIKALTINPAKLYKLNAGTLSEGAPADMVIFDPEEQWTVPDHFVSKACNSPFIDMKLYGKVKATICGGNVVFRDN